MPDHGFGQPVAGRFFVNAFFIAAFQRGPLALGSLGITAVYHTYLRDPFYQSDFELLSSAASASLARARQRFKIENDLSAAPGAFKICQT